MLTNCPRCNMFLAPGAQECPQCRMNFAQGGYQQTQYPPSPQQYPPSQPQFQPNAPYEPETLHEKNYRKLLIGVFILIVSEFFMRYIPYWLGGGLFALTSKLLWLTTLAWAGFPLLFAFAMPKYHPSRQMMITLASIWLAIRLIAFAYMQYSYFNVLGDFGLPGM